MDSLHNGNGIFSFSKLNDIKAHLRKQWAALFQLLLKEQRNETQANMLKHQNLMNSNIQYLSLGGREIKTS